MNNPLLRDVRMDERLRFLRDGVVCLRQIIAPEWIRRAQDGVEHEQVMFESGAGEVARQLTVTRRLRWIYDQLFDTDPMAGTPWHQDTSCGLADSHRIVRVWMPLAHMPRETAIEVVRGSHLWKMDYGWADQFEVRDIEANRRAFDIVGYEVDPGDVVAFNYRSLHHAASGVNFNEKRKAFAILYADDELTLRRRPSPMPGSLETAGLAWHGGQNTLGPSLIQETR